MQKGGWVTIMADRYRGGLYVGVTADLIRRVHQHREGTGSRHVADFAKTRLVYAERSPSWFSAVSFISISFWPFSSNLRVSSPWMKSRSPSGLWRRISL